MGRRQTELLGEHRDVAGGLSRADIHEQLDRILAHREFQTTDKIRDFLRFVVEETLAGREHMIKGYTVATRVFGRGDDFDPAQDPIVSIQAGRLRRALERYYLVAGGRDAIHIEVPKGRYVPRFTERAVEALPDRRRDSERTPVLLHPDTGPAIAVTPFENLTGDSEQHFVAVGLTDDLVTEMNRFQDIVVIPCQRPPAGSGLPLDPSELGRAVGARFVLHGGVRRDTESVKVSARLTETTTGRQVWADASTHPLEASRLIATQEEIARNVVAAICSEYGIIARRLAAESRKKPPAKLDTYEAMLRYYSHQIAPSPESSELCFDALRRAAEREPEYGPVWSALATLHCQMFIMDVPGFDRPLETALRYARRGVSLEPGSQLGRLILAFASHLGDDADGFHQEIETALALNPNSPYTVGTAGYFHVMRGDLELGLPMLDRAIAVNPCHPNWFHTGYLVDHLSRQEYDGALNELQKHRPVLSFWNPAAEAAILGKLGRTDEATAFVEQLETEKPDFAARAHELFRRSLKIDAIIDDLIDGLRIAGMPIDDRSSGARASQFPKSATPAT